MQERILINNFAAFAKAIDRHERTHAKISDDDLTWIAAAKTGDFTPSDNGSGAITRPA